jgi:hypothetical protein
MSIKKEKKTPGLPRMAGKRRQERDERAAAQAKHTAPPAAALPRLPAPPKKIDLLDAFIKSEEKKTDLSACAHKHLLFGKMGAELSCVDCKRRWHILMPGTLGTLPDIGYFNPTMEMESRHTPFEAPRITPDK